MDFVFYSDLSYNALGTLTLRTILLVLQLPGEGERGCQATARVRFCVGSSQRKKEEAKWPSCWERLRLFLRLEQYR